MICLVKKYNAEKEDSKVNTESLYKIRMFPFYWGFWFTMYFRMPWMRQCGIKNHFRIGDVAAVTARLDDAGVCLSWVYQLVTSTACTIAVWNHIRWMCIPSCLNFTHTFTHSLARSLSHCWHIPGVCYMGDPCKLFASYFACYCTPE